MRKLIVLTVVGFFAQLIDGALGMAYGVTSSSLMLASGLAPAAASASVHLAEIGTTAASAAAHARFGNVDWRMVRRLGVPGAIGAFAGATFLSSLSTADAKPWMAGILCTLGLYVLVRFTFGSLQDKRHHAPLRARFLSPLGLVAGFIDATGGGGWGPVATPTLLVSGRVEPRKVIGSVDTSEFLVASAASLGFLIGIGNEGVKLPYVLALLAGGLVAAPLAAWLVRHLPAQLLGSLVGGFIVLTNARTLLDAFDVDGAAAVATYLAIVAGWAAAVAWSVRRLRRVGAPVAGPATAEVTPVG
ncbi:MAG TPA: sulfite exporter TauE/SafE family protein [Acidimicrobiales bacterium]|nr:sulfite exporter TauE/SafE family protein [Acidimicrobiales bacterium]HRA34184.1 sulfite exporter TauE/SafE family protein [Acidimicrobiales bacterium]